MITAALVVLATFAAMEGVSYASHRWLMHGPGMDWHASHHAPPAGRFERNDRFPLAFSSLGFGLFLLTSLGVGWLWPVAIGVTAYGAAYLFVHEVHIHHRLAVALPDARYLRWLREAHAEHHRSGREPYGMLLPLGARRAGDEAALQRLARDARPASTRESRARL